MARKRFGYKPRSISLKGLTARQLIELMKNPAIRIFTVAFGKHYGESRMAGNVPWAGATTGATSTEDALSRLSNVMSAKQVSNCRAFAAGASRAKGVTWVTYPTGEYAPIPNAAMARMSAAKKRELAIEA